MGQARMKVAKLSRADLARVKELEKKLGCCLVALEKEYRFARLTPSALRQLQAAEKKLGVILLAYECN